MFDEAETVAEEHSIAMKVETQDPPTYDAKGKRKRQALKEKQQRSKTTASTKAERRQQ